MILSDFQSIVADYPYGTRWRSITDGYIGTVVGWYITKENKLGVNLQLDNARVVHVYNTKWLEKHD